MSITVDLEASGKQHGFLSLPYSSNRTARGTIESPVCTIKNGDGPTVALIAGTHGDACEGTITLLRLANEIRTEDVRGQLIILPCANSPAVKNGSNCSPLDGLDLGTCFPGKRDGSITQRLAAEISEQIISRSDIIIELQSGGNSMEFAATATVSFIEEPQLRERTEACMIAFGAPNSARLFNPGIQESLQSQVEGLGKIIVVPMLGNGSNPGNDSLSIAYTGCRNVLSHTAVLDIELELRATRMLEVADNGCFVTASCDGMLSLRYHPGSEVYPGSVIAEIADSNKTGATPVRIKATRNGILMACHSTGLIQQGDCLAIVADEVRR